MFDRHNDCNISCITPQIERDITLVVKCKNEETGVEHVETITVNLDYSQREQLQESLRRIDFIMSRPPPPKLSWDPYKAVTFKL